MSRISVKKYLVHAILECKDCDHNWQDYLTAQRKASDHVRKTGHTVKGDLGYGVTYTTEKIK